MSPQAPSELFSPLDSARFGRRIGRASLNDPAGLPVTLEACRLEKLDLLFVRCPTHAITTIHALETAGGRLMDTLLYYRRGLRKGPLPGELKPNRVRAFLPEDTQAVARVARACFTGYQGHYHADPTLDRAACDAAYVDWALSCCANHGASLEVLVAEDISGTACGFFVVRQNSPEEGEGWLAGVSPEAEGRGIYWSLMVHAMRRCADLGASRMIVSTQVTNAATQKVYSRLGYDLQSSYHTFHLISVPA